MTKVIPIILSGGAGLRLWPVSRPIHPKPFIEIGGKALLEQALRRASLVADEVLIVTSENNYSQTENLLENMPNAPKTSYLLEPFARNTAPAIALAVRHIKEVYGAAAVCLVLAADHLISDDDAFKQAVDEACKEAKEGNLVVFGIRPTSPETGYGYLEVASVGNAPQPLIRFIEKPNQTQAQNYLAEGRYYWNSGLFCFTAEVMAQNLETHAIDVWSASEGVFSSVRVVETIHHYDKSAFLELPDISIDYAVMEKANKISMIPASFGWSDVGSWDAFASAHQCDDQGNSITGNSRVYFSATKNTYIESTSNESKVIAAVGLENLVIIDTSDALLIADRGNSDSIKTVVNSIIADADVDKQ